MVGWETKPFYMPHSFKTVYTSISDSNADELSPTAGTIVADIATDALTFSTANKWLDLVCDAGNDSITLGHHLNGLATVYKANGDNKPWLTYDGTTNAIEVGPWVQSSSDWTTGTANSTTNLSAS